jgi:hypothetical protein
MRSLSLVFLGSLISFEFASCANTESAAQSRIDAANLNEEVKIGTAYYNRFSRSFEEPWPFGPYSD